MRGPRVQALGVVVAVYRGAFKLGVAAAGPVSQCRNDSYLTHLSRWPGVRLKHSQADRHLDIDAMTNIGVLERQGPAIYGRSSGPSLLSFERPHWRRERSLAGSAGSSDRGLQLFGPAHYF